MADRKISDLTALTTPAAGDYLPIVDISEPSNASKNKRITIEELLRGAPDGTAGAPSIGFESDPNTGIYSPGADQVAISTNGTGRIFVDSNGYSRFTQSIIATKADGTTTAGQIARSSLIITGGSQDDLGIATTGHFRIATGGGVETFRFTSDGKLGLGTSSPGYPLTVASTSAAQIHLHSVTPAIRLSSDTGGGDAAKRAFIGLSTAANAFISGSSLNDLCLAGSTGGKILFGVGNSAKLVIDSSGNVGIGTTTPSAKLDINGDTYIDSGYIRFLDNATSPTGTAMWRPASDTLAFNTLSTERARIDSSGRLLVGTSSGNGLFAGGTQNPQFQIEGTIGNTILASLTANRNDAAGPTFYLAHSRGTAAGGTTVLQSGDQLGILAFAGTDGTDYVNGATITANVDGTPGANDMPGRLVFSSTPSGSASPVERLRITSAGVLQIADAGNIAVGTTTGTKIGTATTQKLGFYNATPVVQPTAVADATDAASVITQLNALLAKLRTLGLIAT